MKKPLISNNVEIKFFTFNQINSKLRCEALEVKTFKSGKQALLVREIKTGACYYLSNSFFLKHSKELLNKKIEIVFKDKVSFISADGTERTLSLFDVFEI